MWTTIVGFFSGIKMYLYLAVGAAFAALLGYAELEKKEKVSAQQASATHDAEQKTATAVATIQRIETHDAIKAEVDKLPVPAVDPQPVAGAPAASAAGELRDSFSRD